MGLSDLNPNTTPAVDCTISYSGGEPWKLALTDERCPESARLSLWQLWTADSHQFNFLLLFYIPLSNLNALIE